MPSDTALSPSSAQNENHAHDSIFAPEYRATTFGIVGLISLVAFEALAVATAMPTAAQALGGLRLYALAFGGTLAAGIVGTTIAGLWCDARGPSPVLWSALGCFIGGLLLAGFAPTMSSLIAGRILQGLGGGGMIVALYALFGRYPMTLRPRLFAALSTGWLVPALIGPALSGLAVEAFGWRSVFLAVPPLAIPAALLLRPALREMAPEQNRPLASTHRVVYATGAGIGICLLHLGGQSRGIAALATLLPAVALTAYCVLHLLPAGTLSARRGLPSVIALRGLACAAYFGTQAFLPLLLARERGLSPSMAGIALTTSAIAWTFGSWYQGHARNGWSRHRFLRIGTTALCLGVALTALTVFAAAPVALAILGWTIAGSGMGLVSASLAMLTLALSPPERHGSNSAALVQSEAAAVSTTMAIGGSLFAALLPVSTEAAYLANFAIAGTMALLSAAIVGRIGAHRFVVN